MPLSWEDEIPPSCPLHDITGAAGAGNTVQETFITPSFLKLAIIPMISIVRIYYKDVITISDPRHSPDLMDRHNYHPVSPCPSVTSSSVITWTPLPSAPRIREQVFILCWSPGSALTPSFMLALLRGSHLARSPTPPHTERQRGHRKGRQEHASGHPSQPGWHPPTWAARPALHKHPGLRDQPQLLVLTGLSCHSTVNTKPLFLGKHYLTEI